MHSRIRGFTLIELMIAVAVVAILVATAAPSFQGQLRKSRRADAQTFAMDVVARQQQFLLDRRTYAVSITAAPADNGLGMTVPGSVERHYTVSLATDTAAPPTFTVTLLPQHQQALDVCGTMRIDQAGAKTAAGTASCW
jgi:type IV pilus assembly protein PilE